MRLIDADALKDRVRGSYDPYHENGTLIDIDYLEDIIDEQTTIGDWISVKERLPEEWKPVLGMVAISELPEKPIIDSMVYIGNIAGEDKWRVCWNHDMLECRVTHWMSLPEPPEVEE